MKSTFRKQIIVTAISMVLGTAAYAGGQKSADFKDADQNSDGAVSFSEAQKALDIDQQQFTQADADNNDQLSSSEYEQIRSGSPAEFAAMEGEKSQSEQGRMSDQPGQQPGSQQSAGTLQGETETDVTAQSRQQEGGDTGMTAGTVQEESRGMSEGSPGAPSTTVPRASDTGTEMASRPAIMPELMNKQVSEIKGMDVKNENGDDVGSIDKVVVATDTNKLYGIVSVGGFLGIGDKHIPIELERLEVRDDQLILPTSMTEDELKNTQAYNEENYLELKDDQMLSQVHAQPQGQQFGATQGEQAGAAPGEQMGSTEEGMSADRFAQLDENNDGQISREEATQGDASLSEGWDQFDQNRDEGIDRTEFSAFEEGNQGGEPSNNPSSDQGTKQTY